MTKEKILILGIIVFIYSCEPNKTQLECKRNDSIQIAQADSTIRINKQVKINEDKRDSIRHIKMEIEGQRAKLEVENDKMTRIKVPQQGRAIATRENQIESESKRIHQIEDTISDLQLKLAAFINSLVK